MLRAEAAQLTESGAQSEAWHQVGRAAGARAAGRVGRGAAASGLPRPPAGARAPPAGAPGSRAPRPTPLPPAARRAGGVRLRARARLTLTHLPRPPSPHLQRAERAECDSFSLLEQLESLIQAKEALASDRAELGRGIGLLRAERELLCQQLQGGPALARRAGGC
jgi:hypothetical protein